MSTPLGSASPCIAAAMRAASRRLTLLYDEVMAPSGIRITQFGILSELGRRDDSPPTLSELAEVLVMERSALGQTLKPLQRDGLIELGQDPRDGRRKPVRLTKAGRAAVTRAKPYWDEAHARFSQFFGEGEMVELRTTLRGIAEQHALRAAFDAPAPHRGTTPEEKP